MSIGDIPTILDLPPFEVGQALLGLIEDQWFDRKSFRVTPRGLAEALVGFANAEGGTIVVGLHDGRVEGTESDRQHRNRLTQAAAELTEPPVRVSWRLIPCPRSDGEPDQLLVFSVEPGPAVHTTTRDEVFLRDADSNRRLAFRERQELAYDKGEVQYDARPVPGVTDELLDRAAIDRFAAALHSTDQDRLLASRGLVHVDGGVTVAAVLGFASEPQRFQPSAFVRLLRYRGTELTVGRDQQLIEDIDIVGRLPEVIDGTVDRLRASQPQRRALDPSGRFADLGLVPEDAWREAVVNAVVHRAYSAPDHVKVRVFDDRIEVESPGRFPGLADPSHPMDIVRWARNPLVARVSRDLGYGQELGEGVRRMVLAMRAAGLSAPEFRQTSGKVIVTLWNLTDPELRRPGLPRDAEVMVRLLRSAGPLRTGDLCGALGLSRPAVLRRLSRLQDAGLVDWAGSSPRDPQATWNAPP